MEDLPMSDSFKVKSSIRDYEVHFIDEIALELKSVIKNGDYIFVDANVSGMSGIAELIAGYDKVIRIDANEQTKSYEGVIPFFEELIVNGFKRNNRLIAIGGGITQDVTAFIASVLYRGVDWIFFPTNFYPPLSIHISTKILASLFERDIRSGVGEMAHYFFVSGPDDVDFFEKAYTTTIGDQSNMREVVKACLSIKKRYIEIDEFDRKERIVFNYGHTFGHAIESITNYDIPHGVAVSFGMDMANFVSVKKGYISLEDFNRAHLIFSTIWKGYSIQQIDINALLKAMEKDKKNENGKLGLILSKGSGNMFRDLTLPDAEFIGWMEEYMKSYQA